MSQRIYALGCLGFCALVACSAAPGAGAPTATRSVALERTTRPATLDETASSVPKFADARTGTPRALEYHGESESDRRFIENAERAIGEYSEFLARAGDRAEFAPAIRRSREQIEDLRAAIDFVRAGAAQRAAH